MKEHKFRAIEEDRKRDRQSIKEMVLKVCSVFGGNENPVQDEKEHTFLNTKEKHTEN